ncbi:hypothetical protein V6N13_073976 [Hibiscus sabdariffa]|uniref:Uncharacterized protein n=1 Tax=Hibiscus sabdariffa TaxID=183260 RepID=A0ABR2U7B0_9ROSI
MSSLAEAKQVELKKKNTFRCGFFKHLRHQRPPPLKQWGARCSHHRSNVEQDAVFAEAMVSKTQLLPKRTSLKSILMALSSMR